MTGLADDPRRSEGTANREELVFQSRKVSGRLAFVEGVCRAGRSDDVIPSFRRAWRQSDELLSAS
jgi:hypothetical protein